MRLNQHAEEGDAVEGVEVRESRTEGWDNRSPRRTQEPKWDGSARYLLFLDTVEGRKLATSLRRHALSFDSTADFFPFPVFFIMRLEPPRMASSGAGWCG